MILNKAIEKVKAPENLEYKIMNEMNSKKQGKILYKRGLIAASLALAVFTTSVVAINAENIKEAIRSISSYFMENKNSLYTTEEKKLENINKGLGVSVELEGKKFTLDSISLDDNFMFVFYTVESESPIEKADDPHWTALFSAPFVFYSINGEDPTNNNREAYFESDYILKGMDRINISQMDIPSKFILKARTNLSNEPTMKKTLRWEIEAQIDKSEFAVESKTIRPNINTIIDDHDVAIEKVVISPLGNQIVVNSSDFIQFALFDDKDNSLDVLNTSFTGGATNSFEFLGGKQDMEYIKLVPLKYIADGGESDMIYKDIGNYPITFELSEYGSIVVTNVEIKDKEVRITYYKDGVTLYDPGFSFQDENGNEVILSKHGAYFDMSIDRENKTYTQILTVYSEENNLNKIKKLGTFKNNGSNSFTLDFDNAVKIPIK